MLFARYWFPALYKSKTTIVYDNVCVVVLISTTNSPIQRNTQAINRNRRSHVPHPLHQQVFQVIEGLTLLQIHAFLWQSRNILTPLWHWNYCPSAAGLFFFCSFLWIKWNNPLYFYRILWIRHIWNNEMMIMKRNWGNNQ